MATPAEKLARSLEALKEIQDRGVVAIRAAELSRVHRERLLANGFLREVMKGWYISSRPDELVGESTAWYSSYWSFCSAYLCQRFGTDWCLSPEQSLSLHAGNKAVPRQLLVRSPRARNKVTEFPYSTSLLDVRASMPQANDIEEKDGLRLFSLPAALTAGSPRFFTHNPTDARAALSMVRDASVVLTRLLEGGHSTISGRLAGAFRNIGRDRIADDIVNSMRAAGYDVRENDPFETGIPIILSSRETSPHVNRIHLMWQQMRIPIIENFPPSPGRPDDIGAYIKRVDEVYVTDAYHSLSIEGYRVNRGLIERVRSSDWNPNSKEGDREDRNALAARGYWQAYQAVRESVRKVLRGENPGSVADEDHGMWFRELFAPSVTAGVLQPADLAGYRSHQVYIRRSMHVPPNPEAMRDAMPVFFDLLREETEPSVRVALGHFVFVYIHPYMDGNGRIARFLMNVMLAADGYPWTVVPVQERDAYLATLEDASVEQNIVPFSDFLARLVNDGLGGKLTAKVPVS
jgi:hypothetical protein